MLKTFCKGHDIVLHVSSENAHWIATHGIIDAGFKLLFQFFQKFYS